MDFSPLATAAALVVALSVHASDPAVQPPSGDSQPAVSETIFVTATRSERPGDALPMSVTAIEKKNVESSPTNNLDDFLRSVPGINLPMGNSAVQFPEMSRVSMRGLGGHRALVLVDGIPINDAYYNYVQWNKVPMSSIDRIEVVRGASASLFGNMSLGGTINVITREPQDRTVDLAVSGGSFGTRRVEVNVEHQVSERLGFFATVDDAKTDGYYRLLALDRGAIDDRSWSDSTNVQLRSDFRPSERFRGFVKAGVLRIDVSQGTTLSSTRRDIRDFAVSTHTAIGRSGDLNLTGYAQDQNFDVISTATVPGRGVEWVSNVSDIPIRDRGASAVWSQSISSAVPLVSLGMDVRRAEATDTRNIFTRSGAMVAVRGNEGAQDFGGAFAQVSWAPAARLEVLTSARFDSWKNYDGREFGPEGSVIYPERSRSVFNPRLSVRYTLGRAAVRAAAYSAFKAPGLRELYRTTQFAGLEILPNPDLRSESLRGAEAGIDFRAGRLSGQVNVFRNEVEDSITRVLLATTPSLRFQTQNLGAIRATGFELIGSARLGAGWTASGGFTHSDSEVIENAADPSLVGNELPETPSDLASLSLEYRHRSSFHAALRLLWASDSWSDASNLLPLDSHTTVDLFASVPAGPVEIFTRAVNVLDEKYLVDYSIGRRLGEPRSLLVGVRYRHSFER